MKAVLINMLFALTFAFTAGAQIKFFKVFSDNGYDFGQGVAQLEDSSFMVTGASSSFQDAPSEVFLLKVDKEGNHLWSKHYGGPETDFGRRVLSWNDSVFFLAGYTNSFGAGGYDYYLVKVDKEGNLLAEKSYGYDGWERMNDAVLTPDSSVVMVGESTSTVNADRDFYIVRTDKNGDTLWTKKFGSSGDDFLNAVLQYDATTFYAVGGHYNVDSSLVKAAVLKFNDQGDVLWLKEFGGYGEYYLNDFYLKNGKLFGGGTRKHPIDGDQDEFLLRIYDDGSYFMYDAEVHKPGDVIYKAVTLYGAETNAYVVSSFKDAFSTNFSWDVGYTRFNNDLDWEWSNPNVPFVLINNMYDDEFGELLKTSDGGWISTGSILSEDLGGSAVYLLKIGPNDDYPTIDLNTVNSLVVLNELNELDGVMIYPNPAHDLITVALEAQLSSISVTVTDLNGSIVYQGAHDSTLELDLSTWERGAYFIRISDDAGNMAVHKLIRQ